MIVLRREIGDVLRDVRQRQGRTLREVSSDARVSLGYLSEVERGQKEASSELLASICDALDVPLWLVLREVSDRVAVAEGFSIPDTVPADLTMSALTTPAGRAEERDDLVRELLSDASRDCYGAPEDLAPVG
ncbi:helix-turn-helix domain-containing protein [Luteimicrobium sp. DT211]|uniref:helix-turn-helix domain-containing protein n=1 Tax=Luteimicrobium sp. DT211 TaxID=3393412 RepID=UPI003CEE726E